MRHKFEFSKYIFAQLLIRLVILPAFFLYSPRGFAEGPAIYGLTAVGTTGYPETYVGNQTVTGTSRVNAGLLVADRYTTAVSLTAIEIITFGTAAGNIKVAIYDHNSTNNLPGNLLFTEVAGATTANTPTTIVINNIYLPAGTYWIVLNTDARDVLRRDSSTTNRRVSRTWAYTTAFPAAMAATGWTSATYADCAYFVGVQIKGYAKAMKAVFSSSAVIDSLSFYAHAPGNVNMALYSDSSGKPGTKNWESGSTAVTASSWTVVSIANGTPTSLTLNSGTYWLAWQWDSANSGPSYTAGSAGDGYYFEQAYGAFPASWVSASTVSSERWSIYATQAIPTVTAISPGYGPPPGGTGITITGTNFASGAAVAIGGVAATGVTWVNSTTITATLPAGSGGADVVVTNPDGQSGMLEGGYTYVYIPFVCATPGLDGSGYLTGIINTYYTGAASVSSGATLINLGASIGASTPIAKGDLLLVIQMQDAAINYSHTNSYGNGISGEPPSGYTNINSAGKYEYVKAVSGVGTGGGTVSFLGPAGGGLLNFYTSANATASQGQRKFQVVRVPQYSTATLTSGLTAARWNGSAGGILTFDVAGALDAGGVTISVDGLGFRGGGARMLAGGAGGGILDYVQPSTVTFHAVKGEGIAGTPAYVYDSVSGTVVTTGSDYPNGSMACGAPGNAGGGGNDGDPPANDQNSGGGGGANGGRSLGWGGRAGRAWNSGLYIGGWGGSSFPAAPSKVVLGGGGGAGARNNGSGAMSSGGAGGGIIIIRAGSVTNTGTLTSNGATGPAPANDAGGGGRRRRKHRLYHHESKRQRPDFHCPRRKRGQRLADLSPWNMRQPSRRHLQSSRPGRRGRRGSNPAVGSSNRRRCIGGRQRDDYD